MAEIRGVIKKDFWYVFLIAGIASVPLFTDYVLTGSDLGATLSQIRVFSENIGSSFPMRIVPLGSMDYGYSGVSFQANLFYLFPALLHMAGMDIGNAYKCALLLCHFATAVIADLCFREIGGTREAGLLGSMLFTWCPYRCSVVYLVGDLGRIAAWMFLPMIALGLKRLYAEGERTKDGNGAFCVLAAGWSLTALSSTISFAVVSVMLFFFFLIMGRESLRRDRLIVTGKVVLAVLTVNAWFLIPLLLRMSDASNVTPMVPDDFCGRGTYLLQYATFFCRGGTGTELVKNGLVDARAVGPGAFVILLLLLCLWSIFVKKYQAGDQPEIKGKWRLLRKMLWLSLLLMILSSNGFPWDWGQGRGLLVSVVFALLHTPAELGIAADLCMICSACLFLGILADQMERELYRPLLSVIVAGSFCTTQFLLNNILFTHSFIRGEEIAGAASLPFVLFTEEPAAWRISEVVSLAAVVLLTLRYAVRRLKK